MRNFFEHYPSFLKFLVPLLVLQQTVFYLFYEQLGLSTMNDTSSPWVYAVFKDHFHLIDGVLLILGGYIADKFKDTRQVLLFAVSAMLLGHSMHMIPLPVVSFLGGLITFLFSSVFFIKITLNIVMLFPFADDYKDNTLLLAILLPAISLLIIATVVSIFFSLEYSMSFFIISLFIYLFLLYLIYQSKNLGFSIEGEEEEDDEAALSKGKWVLAGGIFVMFVSYIAANNLQFIAHTPKKLEVGFGGLFNSFIGFDYLINLAIVIVVPVVLLVYLLRSAKPRSSQLSKIIIGLVSYVVLCFVDLGNALIGSYTLDSFVSIIPLYISQALIAVPLISILTHLNFSKHAGVWLGFLFGGAYLLYYGVEILMTKGISAQVVAWLGLILVVAAIIYIRENQHFISERLALDEANQEIEERVEEDPFDHLVG